MKASFLLKIASLFRKLAEDNEQKYIFGNNLVNINSDTLSKFFSEQLTEDQVNKWKSANSEYIDNKKISTPWVFNGDKFICSLSSDDDEELGGEITKTPAQYFIKSQKLINAGVVNSQSYYGEVLIEQTPKFIGHNGFAFQALSSIVYGTMDLSKLNINLLNKLKYFIDSNSEVISKMMSFINLSPTYIGKGVDGVAFDIGDNKVLKIFRYQDTYNEARKSYERSISDGITSDTEITTYELGKLNTAGGIPELYFSIIEKVKPISNDIKVPFRRVLDAIRKSITRLSESGEFIIDGKINLQGNVDNQEYFLETYQILETSVESIKSFIDSSLGDDILNIESFYNDELAEFWLDTLIKEMLLKFLTKRTDLHSGNLGLNKDGYFRYFDPVAQSGKTKFDVPVKKMVNKPKVVDRDEMQTKPAKARQF